MTEIRWTKREDGKGNKDEERKGGEEVKEEARRQRSRERAKE